jgi:hypothetical protein
MGDLVIEAVSVQDLFDKQKEYFATDVTKTYEWRVDQLNRLTRMLKENYERFADASRRDFKTGFDRNQRIRKVPAQRMDEACRGSPSEVPRCIRA